MEDTKRRRELGLPEQYLYEKDTKAVNYSDFVNKELVLFSNCDNERSIPSMVDGLKPGQRKVLYISTIQVWYFVYSSRCASFIAVCTSQKKMLMMCQLQNTWKQETVCSLVYCLIFFIFIFYFWGCIVFSVCGILHNKIAFHDMSLFHQSWFVRTFYSCIVPDKQNSPPAFFALNWKCNQQTLQMFRMMC